MAVPCWVGSAYFAASTVPEGSVPALAKEVTKFAKNVPEVFASLLERAKHLKESAARRALEESAAKKSAAAEAPEGRSPGGASAALSPGTPFAASLYNVGDMIKIKMPPKHPGAAKFTGCCAIVGAVLKRQLKVQLIDGAGKGEDLKLKVAWVPMETPAEKRRTAADSAGPAQATSSLAASGAGIDIAQVVAAAVSAKPAPPAMSDKEEKEYISRVFGSEPESDLDN